MRCEDAEEGQRLEEGFFLIPGERYRGRPLLYPEKAFNYLFVRFCIAAHPLTAWNSKSRGGATQSPEVPNGTKSLVWDKCIEGTLNDSRGLRTGGGGAPIRDRAAADGGVCEKPTVVFHS